MARSRAGIALVAVLVAWSCLPAAAEEATVSGDADALTVEADSVATVDVVAAISDHLGLPLVVPPDAGPETITGTYRGSLARVLRTLMPNASFVVSRGPDNHIAVRFLDVVHDEPGAVAEAKPSGSDDGGADEQGEPQSLGERGGRNAPGQGHGGLFGGPPEQEPPPPVRQVY